MKWASNPNAKFCFFLNKVVVYKAWDAVNPRSSLF